MAGKRFGRLVVMQQTERRDYRGGVCWLCKCDCGNETVVSGIYLRRGITKSCGCLSVETARNTIIKAYNARRKHFGCLYCGSDKHYAKGCCKNCYYKLKRGTLKY